jgi:hypothetical protein
LKEKVEMKKVVKKIEERVKDEYIERKRAAGGGSFMAPKSVYAGSIAACRPPLPRGQAAISLVGKGDRVVTRTTNQSLGPDLYYSCLSAFFTNPGIKVLSLFALQTRVTSRAPSLRLPQPENESGNRRPLLLLLFNLAGSSSLVSSLSKDRLCPNQVWMRERFSRGGGEGNKAVIQSQ